MKKWLFILGGGYVLWLIEFILFQGGNIWLRPNLLLLFIIFTTLFFGIRYGIIAALWAGWLKESMMLPPGGIYLVSFTVCAYVSPFLRKNIFPQYSQTARLFLVLTLITIAVMVEAILYAISGVVDISATFFYILLPQWIITGIISISAFRLFKSCASKLSA